MRSLNLVVLVWVLASATVHGQRVFQINEFFRNGTFATDEWTEVVLLQDLTAAQLQTYYMGDSQSGTTSKLSAYQFANMSSIAAVFKAGTIIVLAGSTGPAADTSYNPAGGDWNLTLRIGTSNVATVTAGGDYGGTDVSWIDTASSGATISSTGMGVNWGAGVFGLACPVTIGVTTNNSGVVYTSGFGAAQVTTPANYTLSQTAASLTAGQPNGGANTTAINALRNPDTTVSSITRADASPTNAATVNFTVTFAASVSGLSASNFTLSPTVASAAIGSITPTSGTTFNVPVSIPAGSDGSVGLNFNNATGMTPSVTNTLSGETYVVDRVAPSATLSNILGQDDSVIIDFDDTMLNAMTLGYYTISEQTAPGLGTIVSGSNPLTITPGAGDAYALAFSGTLGESGSVNLTVNAAVTDDAGNALVSSTITGSVPVELSAFAAE